MVDVNAVIKKHPVAAWIGFLFSAAMAVVGAITTVLTLYDNIQGRLHHKTMLAVVINGQFGLGKYDIIGIGFRNPTTQTETVGDVALDCVMQDGGHVQVNTMNNVPKEWNFVHGIDYTPLTLQAGESKNVEFVVLKDEKFAIEKSCASIKPVWNDADYHMEVGDIYRLDVNIASFGNVVANRADASPTGN